MGLQYFVTPLQSNTLRNVLRNALHCNASTKLRNAVYSPSRIKQGSVYRLVAEWPRLGTEDLVGRLLDPRDDVHEDRDPPNLSLVSKRLLS